MIDQGRTQTLGGQAVTLNGHHVSIRFDARQGRRFTVTPTSSGDTSRFFYYEANICADDIAVNTIEGPSEKASYVIPSSSRALGFSYHANWERTLGGPFFYVRGATTHGVPSHMTFNSSETMSGSTSSTRPAR